MKLLDYETWEDFGKEYFIQVIQFYPKFALIDLTFQWDDYSESEIFPMILLSIGNRSLCGVTFRWRRFYFKCDIINGDPRNLEWYRTNRYEN